MLEEAELKGTHLHFATSAWAGPSHAHLPEGNLGGFALFLSESTAADQPLIWPFLQTPTCPVVLPGGWPEDNAMHFLCFLSA